MCEQVRAIAVQHEPEKQFRIHPRRRDTLGGETFYTSSQGLLELHGTISTRRRKKREETECAHCLGIGALALLAGRTKASAPTFKELNHGGSFLLQLLRLVMRDQSIDQRLDLAIHDRIQLVDGEADAMIG